MDQRLACQPQKSPDVSGSIIANVRLFDPFAFCRRAQTSAKGQRSPNINERSRVTASLKSKAAGRVTPDPNFGSAPASQFRHSVAYGQFPDNAYEYLWRETKRRNLYFP
jgi:hypothetical protein